MRRPNPLPPDQMTPAERRAELCGLLALGLIRLDIGINGLNVRLRVDGLGSLAREMLAGGIEAAA